MARNNRAKPKKQGTVTLTKREIEKIKKDATNDAVKLASRLAVAVMVENHNLTEDQIFEDMECIARWATCVDKHWLSIKEIDEIIERKGGVRFGGF